MPWCAYVVAGFAALALIGFVGVVSTASVSSVGVWAARLPFIGAVDHSPFVPPLPEFAGDGCVDLPEDLAFARVIVRGCV